MEIKNAIIESATLSTADHGVLTGWLHLDYGGSGQGFGGNALYLPKCFQHHSGQLNYAGHWIFRVMEIADVEKWDDLKGRCIRVKATNSGIEAIGHIVKDKWFDVKKEFAELEE